MIALWNLVGFCQTSEPILYDDLFMNIYIILSYAIFKKKISFWKAIPHT